MSDIRAAILDRIARTLGHEAAADTPEIVQRIDTHGNPVGGCSKGAKPDIIALTC